MDCRGMSLSPYCEKPVINRLNHARLVCLTTGPKPPSKRALHIVRSRASSFRCEYPLLSLRLCSSFPRLLPRLPVISIRAFIFLSITCRRLSFYAEQMFSVAVAQACATFAAWLLIKELLHKITCEN
jgi:hypothetical protein